MKKKTIASMRRPGGVSRSIDYLRLSLLNQDPTDEAAKPGAVLELSELMVVAINQTAHGDAECGYFLAELLAYLWKRRSRLSDQNETFRKCYSTWESSRLATRSGSPLRPLIHAILDEAHRDRRVQQITKSIPKGGSIFKLNKTLLALPEFSADPKVVSEWTDKIVYPKLRAMQSELAEDPVIGNLKKALDDNGKFHVSRLKTLIKQTVARIAALPKAYYFDIS
jgi:hypothetical protein